jgi:D,D-heptose 1,7-bisphosphate phosphatase
MPGRSAVFLDRDGTVMEDTGYPDDPDDVRLLTGAAAAIARLNRAGLLVVLVTNQSGIGRGFYDEAAFRAVQRRLVEALAAEDAHLDAVYFCPHSPDREPPCDCRKPAAGMFERAARDHSIDLAASFFVGDRTRDIQAGLDRGGTGILVGAQAGEEPPDTALREPSLAAATDRILAMAEVDAG